LILQINHFNIPIIMKRFLKWMAILTGVLTFLALAAILFVYIGSNQRLEKKHAVPPLEQLVISEDTAILERGKHLVVIANCVFCHGMDMGGSIYNDGPLGTVVGPNLTKGIGGIGSTFTNDDWVRSIRHGVRRDGTSLLVMPSEVYVNMSIEDLSAVVSYIKQVPPVDRKLPPTKIALLGRALFAMGKASILVAEKTDHDHHPEYVSPGDTLKYGRYLADIGGCRGCHGLNLSGGRVAGPPGTPLTANLTPEGLGTWTEEQFKTTLRTGVRPNKKPIDRFMPWQLAGQMTDAELHSLWVYLKSVPRRKTGNR
jgi:mono/diheme cytochrome c family protein